jgi:hypothetical protein
MKGSDYMDANIQQQLITEGIKIFEILLGIGGVVLATYHTKIRGYLYKKTNAIDNEDVRKFAKETIDVIDKLVTNEVTNADIILKPAIIQAISDGKVTANELISLKGIVKDKVLQQLTDDSKNAVSTTIANLDTYLDSTVETILGQLKLDPTSPVSKTVIPEVATEVVDNTEESKNTNSDLPNQTPDNPELNSNDTNQIVDSNIVIPQ